MDPTANLREQRTLIARMLNDSAFTWEDAPDFSSDALRLAELQNAMDTWLTNGGALPIQWANKRERSV